MNRAGRVVGLCLLGGLSGVALVVACGARTGLGLIDAIDATRHAHDATEEAPFDAPAIREAHALDVKTECDTPTYCGADPNYIYKCGKKIYQCSSLEECIEPCGEAGPGDACAAECVNPCLHTLGENTSNGCEFYAVEMDGVPTSVGACYAVFVVNQWQTGQAAQLVVDLGVKEYSAKELEGFARIPKGTGTKIDYAPYSASKGLAQNEIAILFLSRDPDALLDDAASDPRRLASCPPGVTPAVLGDAAIHGTGIGQAFHLRSNVPVVAYQMLPYGGGHARITGATLLLPINVWGTNYIAANAYPAPSNLVCDLPDGGPFGCSLRAGPTMAILAQEDATHVTINPVKPIVGGGGLAGTGAGEPITYTVNKGQYLQLTQQDELTGSPIQADAPIAVLGGSTLMDIPVTGPGYFRADHGEQMLPPVQALGSEYVAVRYRSRNAPVEESVPWRIVGAVSGTTLTYDPAPPSGAPTTLSSGQVVEFWAPGPFVVSSDGAHPFYLAQYMTGGAHLPFLALSDAGPDASVDTSSLLWGQGDPEFVNVVAPAQYLPGYTFFTDPTYPETNLVVVAAKDVATSQFPNVSLDCAGTLSGWQPVGTSGKYQFTRIDLSTGNYVGQNGCDNGVHTIQASLPAEAAPPGDAPLIGVTVWGWGSQATLSDIGMNESDPRFTCWVSYGYPAGANVKKLNTVVVPAR